MRSEEILRNRQHQRYSNVNIRINHKKPCKDSVASERRLKDSRVRRVFESGAVRDIQEGKGRCDFMPLDTVAELLFPHDLFMKYTLEDIQSFMQTIDYDHLNRIVDRFLVERKWLSCDALLEVAKRYEDGAKKYGEHNCEKGIPAHSYVDSAIRHLTKWRMGLTDEPHDRAFLWNIICLAWTCKNHPNLIDFCSKSNEAPGADTDIATSLTWDPDTSVSTITKSVSTITKAGPSEV